MRNIDFVTILLYRGIGLSGGDRYGDLGLVYKNVKYPYLGKVRHVYGGQQGGSVNDEQALLEAAKAFDPAALETIFDTYSVAIYRYALRLCRDAVEADHIVGDVFSQLLEKFANGDGPRTNLRSYLYQIAYHIIVDHARMQSRESPLDVAEYMASGVSFVSTQAEDNVLMDTLMKAINNDLTVDQRHVIVLHFVEGLNIKEIAEVMGKSINNVKVLQNRAFGKLRHVLNRVIEEG